MVLCCNKCGKKINNAYGGDREDFLHVIKDWGYFSERDLQTHEFVLCEKCYDEIIDNFIIPVKVKDRDEVL